MTGSSRFFKIYPLFLTAIALSSACCSASLSRGGANMVQPSLSPPTGTTPTQPRTEQQSMQVADSICAAVVDRMWDRSDYWWHHGDYPRVISCDRTITEIDPHFLQPYSVGGWLLESDGDLKGAEAYYRLGCDRNPTKTYIWYQLGMFYFNTLKDYDKSIAVFSISTKLSGAELTDWKMLAHSYEHANEYPQALATWKQIKHRYPSGVAVDVNLKKIQAIVDSQNAQRTQHA